tara:strand:+ start:87 stop:380 length:294 start_codon:yes stop_codon:yes gene_type:complete
MENLTQEPTKVTQNHNLMAAHERLLETENRMDELRLMSDHLLRKLTRQSILPTCEEKESDPKPTQNLIELFNSVNGRISYSMDEVAQNINRVMEMID